MKYDFISIEERWQKYWAQHATFRAHNPGDPGFDAHKPKFYVLDMFPYPSGVGLHVGHPLGYIATDIVARYRRMRGANVLHPMGYDAFGLPAEQFAVEQGIHPKTTTDRNIANMTRQLKRLGLSYDWDRSLATTDAEYYKWTQWIFLRIYHSWFDPIQHKARPIAELRQLLVSGQVYIGLDDELIWAGNKEGLDGLEGQPIGSRRWHELSAVEQRDFLDGQRLAYLDEIPVNWCPALGTVLANEEVTNDGKSERGDFPVYKRPLKQWMLRITTYADRLSEDLDLVDWPEPIKLMQRNWIGRSAGASVAFPLAFGAASGADDVITVFTTRPDTLFGATYLVLAPEHPLVEAITTPGQYHEVSEYRQRAAAKTDEERAAEATSGTAGGGGVFTGAFALNPVNNATIPIWIADYVLMGYGTGAIMAVPAHDQRDFAFAQQFGLPVHPVVMPDDAWLLANATPHQGQGAIDAASAQDSQLRDELRNLYLCDPKQFGEAFSGAGVGVNSANDELSLDDLPTAQAQQTITVWLTNKGLGQGTVQYKLRDWLFSRQRYWGEPFPILHGPDGAIVPVDDRDLPVLLPEMADFRPTASDDPAAPPQPPLARAPDSWKYVERQGVRYTREFNTMPQWAGSCWYYLRFCDPRNDHALLGKEAEQYWMQGPKVKDPGSKLARDPRIGAVSPGGVDLYVGGVEHAVLHLLYARFWHKVLFDLGHVSTPEPFGKLFNQGYIQAHAYKDQRGIYVPAEQIEERAGRFYYKGEEVAQEFGKMGKSLKNAITPDDICADYGCDTLRLYEMYLGPLDQSKVWRTRDIAGIHRFLQRVWRLFVDEETDRLRVADQPVSPELQRKLHKTIKRVTEAMETMSFNVAIAALIELNNDLVKQFSSDENAQATMPRPLAQTFVLLLAPLAPHLSEELWSRLGHNQSLAYEPWPQYDPAWLVEEEIEYPVQVNGKLRGKIKVPTAASDQAVIAAALADEKIQACTAGKTVRKTIVVKGKMVNFVVG